ncbi:MAG: hypothetical protein ABWX85_09295, partial [Arthrobacter sp.]
LYAAGTPTSLTSKGARMGWLDRERTIAPPGFNRWLVPPAAPSTGKLVDAWALVGVPLGYGVYETLTRVAAPFG